MKEIQRPPVTFGKLRLRAPKRKGKAGEGKHEEGEGEGADALERGGEEGSVEDEPRQH